MEPVLATLGQRDEVMRILRETIEKVYPAYYPAGAIDFFLDYHSPEAVGEAIARGEVYLFREGGQFVATGSLEGDYLTRLFVLPEHQGKGYGSRIMDFLEAITFRNHPEARLDASLPAVDMYLKRGYAVYAYHREPTFRGHYLCYLDMRKRRPG
jgi:GNAT superfamily N-acetyltransferase